jgi:hypothetical protein
MGIYTSDIVYGVRIDQKNSTPNCDLNKEFIILYEKYNDDKKEFLKEEKLEALSFYESLEDKSKIRFFIYTECATSYDIDDKPFMTWIRIDKDEFYDLLQK